MYVIEAKLPDGWNWFQGVSEKVVMGQKLYVNLWTPYYEDAQQFTTVEEADMFNNSILKDSAARVAPVNKCHKRNGAFMVEMDGVRRMCRLVRMSDLKQGETFIMGHHPNDRLTVDEIRGNQILIGGNWIDRFTRQYVTKIY